MSKRGTGNFYIYFAQKFFENKTLRIFCKKLRIWASTESFLQLSKFEYSKLLTSLLKVSERSSFSLYLCSMNISKQGFLKYLSSTIIQETSENEAKTCYGFLDQNRRTFYKKLRIGARTESFLRLSDFSSLTVPS